MQKHPYGQKQILKLQTNISSIAISGQVQNKDLLKQLAMLQEENERLKAKLEL